MISARITHDGSTRFAIAGLNVLDARILQAAGKGLAGGLNRVSGIAQQKFLSGPRPEKLDVVTTRLRGSIETAVDVSADRVVGRIGSNVPYAPVHEFGLVGSAPIKVRAHTRTVEDKGGIGLERLREVKNRKTGTTRVLSDLYRFDKSGKIIGRKRTLRQLAQKQGREDEVIDQQVRAHERTDFKYQGRPFLRPALQQGGPIILSEIKKQLAALSTLNS